MTLENNVSESEIDLMRDLRPTQSAEAPTEPTSPGDIVTHELSVQPETKPVTEQAEQQTTSDDPELERLRRIVAMDPYKRQAYEQEQLMHYGYAPPQQHQVQQPMYQQPVQEPVQQQPQLPQLPFNAETYDPYNPDHAQALMGVELAKQLMPFAEFIEAQRKEAEQLERQQKIRAGVEKQKFMLDSFEKHIPGYSKLFRYSNGGEYNTVESLTPEQMAVVQSANTLFQQELSFIHPQLHQDQRVLKDVLTRIAPKVKRLSDRLGAFQGVQAADPAVARESYVENSNIAPMQKQNAFSAALERHDDVAMMGMIRQMR